MRTAAAPILKGRPVTSFDEVRASSIDFDGSVFYFPDVTNHKIYTKQINADGTVGFGIYERKEIPISTDSIDFVTRQEFTAALNELKAFLVPPQPAPMSQQVSPAPQQQAPAPQKQEFNF